MNPIKMHGGCTDGIAKNRSSVRSASKAKFQGELDNPRIIARGDNAPKIASF
jgi:hypothetical protein